MADMAKRGPRSVPDPDREAFDRSVAENRALAPVGAFGGGVWGADVGAQRGKKIGQRVVNPYRDAKGYLTRELQPLYDPFELYKRMRPPY
jgi:hypothetical protein